MVRINGPDGMVSSKNLPEWYATRIVHCFTSSIIRLELTKQRNVNCSTFVRPNKCPTNECSKYGLGPSLPILLNIFLWLSENQVNSRIHNKILIRLYDMDLENFKYYIVLEWRF